MAREASVKIEKWGESLAVRLPASMVDALELKEGDQIDIQVAVQRVMATSESRATLLGRLEKFRDRLPAGFGFDREDANER